MVSTTPSEWPEMINDEALRALAELTTAVAVENRTAFGSRDANPVKPAPTIIQDSAHRVTTVLLALGPGLQMIRINEPAGEAVIAKRLNQEACAAAGDENPSGLNGGEDLGPRHLAKGIDTDRANQGLGRIFVPSGAVAAWAAACPSRAKVDAHPPGMSAVPAAPPGPITASHGDIGYGQLVLGRIPFVYKVWPQDMQ